MKDIQKDFLKALKIDLFPAEYSPDRESYIINIGSSSNDYATMFSFLSNSKDLEYLSDRSSLTMTNIQQFFESTDYILALEGDFAENIYELILVDK